MADGFDPDRCADPLFFDHASEGRFVLGLGSSSDVVVERFNDGTFAKPLSKVREAVERLRPVLTAPPEKGLGGLRLERPVTDTVPIILAALRERMLGLAGELADGAFTNFATVRGPFFDRLAEVESDEDTRIRILGRRLGETGIRAEDRRWIAAGAPGRAGRAEPGRRPARYRRGGRPAG